MVVTVVSTLSCLPPSLGFYLRTHLWHLTSAFVAACQGDQKQLKRSLRGCWSNSRAFIKQTTGYLSLQGTGACRWCEEKWYLKCAKLCLDLLATWVHYWASLDKRRSRDGCDFISRRQRRCKDRSGKGAVSLYNPVTLIFWNRTQEGIILNSSPWGHLAQLRQSVVTLLSSRLSSGSQSAAKFFRSW